MFLHLGHNKCLLLKDILVILDNHSASPGGVKSIIITADREKHYSPISSNTLKKRINSIKVSGGETYE
jgi:hypothetical protein